MLTDSDGEFVKKKKPASCAQKIHIHRHKQEF